MTNILVDTFPDTVSIHGESFAIETDFRACLRTLLALEDGALTQVEKNIVLFANMYPNGIPSDREEAAKKASWFLSGCIDDDPNGDNMRLYSFSQDAQLIFAAFRQTHGIDLDSVEMHWHKFLALFMDLGQDTVFCQLVGMRKRVKTGKATKEERQAARDMGKMFFLDAVDDMTLEEREAEEKFNKLIEEGKRNREERKAKLRQQTNE